MYVDSVLKIRQKKIHPQQLWQSIRKTNIIKYNLYLHPLATRYVDVIW